MKRHSIIAGAIAMAICSCTTMKHGSNTISRIYQLNPPTATASAKETATEVPVICPEKVNAPLSVPQIAESKAEEGVLLASAGNDDALYFKSFRSQLASEMREMAPTIENKFARRIVYNNAARLEKMNFATAHKSSFFDKAKAKISNKILTHYAAREGRMSGADILAIVSLATGLFAFAWYASFPFGVAAIVTGAIALARGTDRRGMAIVGIIFGAIAIAFWSGYIVIH